MNRWLKSPVFYLLLAAALGLRTWRAQQAFETQREIFGPAQKGFFTVGVLEEPEVLFEHLPGSHDTGRAGGFYRPFVREVRAVCILLSRDGRSVPPVKIRCAFKFSPGVSQRVLSYGDKVDIEGKIQLPNSAMNPGSFIAIL